jgi:hypothetical protein
VLGLPVQQKFDIPRIDAIEFIAGMGYTISVASIAWNRVNERE